MESFRTADPPDTPWTPAVMNAQNTPTARICSVVPKLPRMHEVPKQAAGRDNNDSRAHCGLKN
jgi:hypothetical protein